MKRRVERAQEPAHAVGDDRHVGFAAALVDDLHALGNEVEHVVLEPQAAVLGPGRAPVDHVDVEAAVEQELDQAVARRQVEDVGLADQGHDQQDRRPVHLVHARPVVVQAERAPAVDRVLRRQAYARVAGRDVLEALDAPPERALHFAPHALRDPCGRVQNGRCATGRRAGGRRRHSVFCSEGGRRVRAGRGAGLASPFRPTAWASSPSIRRSLSSTAVKRSASSLRSLRVGRFTAWK